MARRERWRRFEDQVEALLRAYRYAIDGTQVNIEPVRSRRQARKAWPDRKYLTPRFDIIAQHPLTRRRRYVECKRYETPVNVGLVDGFAYRLWLCGVPYSRGLLVVQPRLTVPALKQARQYGMGVWHDATLERKLATAGLLVPGPRSIVTVPYHSVRYLARLVT